MEIAHLISASDLIWTSWGTDQELMNAEEVAAWRTEQADVCASAFAASVGRGSIHAYYEGRGEAIERLIRNERAVGLPHFVQFGIVAPGHFQATFQAALRRFAGPMYRKAWETREVLIDTKGPGRHGGPRLLDEILLPILASHTLRLPAGYGAVGHPIADLLTKDGGLPVLDFLGGSPRYVTSVEEPLVQIADLIGWAVRRRITHPAEEATRALYGVLLRTCRRTDDGRPVNLMYRSSRPRPDDARYRVLLHA
jgi:hypothetical protein